MKKLLLCLITLCGCSANTTVTNNSLNSLRFHENGFEVYKNTNNFNEDISKIEQFQMENKTIEHREALIIQGLNEIDEIDQVTVNIIGNNIVVSVSFHGEINTEKFFNLKNNIKNKVRQLDSEIDHVIVNLAS